MTKHKGPIITLAAGVVLATVLMVVNLSVTKQRPAETAANTTNLGPTATTPPPATVTSAPATTPPPVTAPVTYAGKVSGNGATLAIVISDGKVIAYVCDGKAAEAWLQGTATGGSLDLTGENGATLTGTYGNGVAAGNVSATGKQWAFSLKTVAPPSGLYRATANVRNARLVGGWIVLENGQQVGLVKLGDNTVSAPPLDTATKTAMVEGTAVTVAAIDGSGL